MEFRTQDLFSVHPMTRHIWHSSQHLRTDTKATAAMLHSFDHLIGQCPGDQISIGHGVPMMQNSKTPDLQKTKSVVVKKKEKKKEELKFTLLKSVLEQLP